MLPVRFFVLFVFGKKLGTDGDEASRDFFFQNKYGVKRAAKQFFFSSLACFL